MKPVVDGLKKDYEDKVEFRIYNLEEEPNGEGAKLADSLGVTAVPTFVFVNSDGVSAGTVVGGIAEDQFRTQLDQLQ